jgi:hypothetical protein
VTLQDVALLLGLSIDGHPVCGPTDPTSWRDMVGEFISICPLEVTGPNEKDKKPSGVHSGWLTVWSRGMRVLGCGIWLEISYSMTGAETPFLG